MGSYTIGIFVSTKNQQIEIEAKKQWSFSEVKEVEKPYVGYAIYGHDIKHYNFKDFKDFQKIETENDSLFQSLASFSKKFPDEKFVLMEEDEHGDSTSYQGICHKNGVVIINEMGDFDKVFSEYRKEFENGEMNWHKFYHKRLRTLLSNLGIILGKNVYFELFDRMNT